MSDVKCPTCERPYPVYQCEHCGHTWPVPDTDSRLERYRYELRRLQAIVCKEDYNSIEEVLSE